MQTTNCRLLKQRGHLERKCEKTMIICNRKGRKEDHAGHCQQPLHQLYHSWNTQSLLICNRYWGQPTPPASRGMDVILGGFLTSTCVESSQGTGWVCRQGHTALHNERVHFCNPYGLCLWRGVLITASSIRPSGVYL